jgi:GTP-binding protein Era
VARKREPEGSRSERGHRNASVQARERSRAGSIERRFVVTAPVEGAETRCGFVALVGAPNAGKSTLLNQLVGAKVSIVSRKAQTTRALVRGIAIAGNAQIILVDTPGIFAPKRRLERAMVASALTGAGDADAIALLIDARRGLDPEIDDILEKLGALSAPKVLILNKIDLVPRESLLALTAELAKKGDFAEVFMISALSGDGVDDLREKLGTMMKPSPWLYPEDQLSDAPLRILAAEITREKIFERLHDELPYQSTVETESWQTQKDGSARIEQTIYVARDGQKKIVIGEGGRTIKAIGQAARREIEEAAEQKVHLFLFVKVRENWADDPERIRRRLQKSTRLSMSSAQGKRSTVYRYLTGPDDASFCHRVTEALSNGWSLYGPPTLTYDAAKGRVICGQAITKDVPEFEYSPDVKLSEL